MKDWRIYTNKTLKQLDIKPTRTMGQNFLIRYKVVHDIIRSANIQKDEHILEIGGGLGILTDAISTVTKKLTIIEKDIRLAKYLEKTFPHANVIIGDALTVQWPEDVKLISNLPYSISSPIIQRILHHPLQSATIMVQKEIADRCVAKPGQRDYSRLSVLCSLHSIVQKQFSVNPDAFQPKPKVTSTVMCLEKRELKTTNFHSDIELLANNLFSLRRRVLRSVLRGFLKRKVDNDDIWNNVPYADQRINKLSATMLDEVLTYLIMNESWPIA